MTAFALLHQLQLLGVRCDRHFAYSAHGTATVWDGEPKGSPIPIHLALTSMYNLMLAFAGTKDRMHLQQAAQPSKSFGHQSSVADVAAASAPEPVFYTDGQTEFDLGHAADGNRKPSQSPKRRR